MITNKPYTPSQKIIRTLFRGKPNFYADTEINRQGDLQAAINTVASRQSGGTLGSASEIKVISAAYDGSGALTYSIQGKGTFIFQGSEFQIDTPVINNTTFTGYPEVRVFLVGKRATATFASDPNLCGLVSTLVPQKIPGADVEVWAETDVVTSWADSKPAMNPGWELISIIAAIVPEAKIDANSTTPYYVPSLYYEGTEACINTHLDYFPSYLTVTPSYATQWQAMGQVLRFAKQIRASLTGLIRDLTSYVSISNLIRTKGEMQMLTPSAYNANDYDSDGKGKSGTKAYGWQLNNGKNGTNDDTGLFFIGGTSNSNNKYLFGAVGGEETHQLIREELPSTRLRHSASKRDGNLGSGSNDWSNTAAGNPGQRQNGANALDNFTEPMGNDYAHNNMPPFRSVIVRTWVGF